MTAWKLLQDVRIEYMIGEPDPIEDAGGCCLCHSEWDVEDGICWMCLCLAKDDADDHCANCHGDCYACSQA